jgi:glycosyltransferase involved in cell wall biosynthesis
VSSGFPFIGTAVVRDYGADVAQEGKELRVSVIVPVRNGGDDLRRLLVALDQQTLAADEFEVVIGDDGSSDGSCDDFAQAGRVHVLHGPPRNSYAARNRAVAGSRAPVLAFCDADCVPEPEWLEEGLKALERSDLAAGRIFFDPPARRTVWTLLDMDSFKDHERQVEQGTAETANLFLSRALYDRVGGFDDSLPEHGDFDFVARCVASGATLAFAPLARVSHPTRNAARPFLRAVWIYNRWYAAREARAGRLPEGLKVRSWVPFVQRVRSRRRFHRTLGPDRRWLRANGVQASLREELTALPLMYLVVPYVAGAAQLRGWRDGRRLR